MFILMSFFGKPIKLNKKHNFLLIALFLMRFDRVDFAQENDSTSLLVHNGVQERVVGDERGWIHRRNVAHASDHADASGSSAFGSIFVDVDVSLMNSTVDLQVLLAHAAKVGLVAEDVVQTHFAQDIFQVNGRADGEFRHLDFDLAVFQTRDDVPQFFARQAFLQVAQTVPGFRQDDDHGQIGVFIGQFDSVQIVGRNVTVFFGVVHELDVLLVVAVAVEGVLLGHGLVERIFPRSFEVDGVGQNHADIFGQDTSLEELWDLVGGLLGHPFVDFFHALVPADRGSRSCCPLRFPSSRGWC